MGTWHAHAASAVGGEIHAIVDPRLAAARRLAARHPRAETWTSVEQLLQYARIDVAHLCTPPETHVPVAESLLRAGCHILVEKPLAETARETDRLLAVAEAHAVVLCPVHQFLFQDGVAAATAHLSRIGRLRHVHFTACSAGAAANDEHGTDRVVLDILPHPLSLLARLLPHPLDSFRWIADRPAPGEFRGTASGGGVSIAITISMHGRPTVNELRLIGEAGTLHLDLFHGFEVREPGAVSRARKVLRPFSVPWQTLFAASRNLMRRGIRGEPAYPGLRPLVGRFYAAAKGEAPPPIAATEIRQVAGVRDQLRSQWCGSQDSPEPTILRLGQPA